jgi:hypothetical protein
MVERAVHISVTDSLAFSYNGPHIPVADVSFTWNGLPLPRLADVFPFYYHVGGLPPQVNANVVVSAPRYWPTTVTCWSDDSSFEAYPDFRFPTALLWSELLTGQYRGKG